MSVGVTGTVEVHAGTAGTLSAVTFGARSGEIFSMSCFDLEPRKFKILSFGDRTLFLAVGVCLVLVGRTLFIAGGVCKDLGVTLIMISGVLILVISRST